VAVGIQEDGVLRPGKAGHHAEVRLVTGGEHDALLHAQEAGKFVLKLLVNGIAAIGNARARRAGAELAQARFVLPRCTHGSKVTPM
jgi:hypothetical protein